jgi:hypothetical protein
VEARAPSWLARTLVWSPQPPGRPHKNWDAVDFHLSKKMRRVRAFVVAAVGARVPRMSVAWGTQFIKCRNCCLLFYDVCELLEEVSFDTCVTYFLLLEGAVSITKFG